MNDHISRLKKWKENNLDTKSASFCGAKWFNASIWLWQGTTTSCHHNPWHEIDVNEIIKNPKALHNTEIKKQERAMMKKGEKPLNCQFCWKIEELESAGLSDRVWQSNSTSLDELERAFNSDINEDFDLEYLELGLDKTCQMACSYCCPTISSSWSKDIKQNGPYEGLKTDRRNHYLSDSAGKYDFKDYNPLTEAFLKWWNNGLSKSLKQFRITGGEPVMSGHLNRILQLIIENSNNSTTVIEITTNLSYEQEKLNELLALVKQIKNKFRFCISIDNIKQKGEYVRDGLDWSLWESNLQKVICNTDPNDNIMFVSTISALTIDGYSEFLEWLAEKKKFYNKDRFRHSANILRFPTFQSVTVLPKEIRQIYSEEISEVLNKNQKYYDHFEVDQILRVIKYLNEVDTAHQEQRVTHEKHVYNENQQFDSIDELQKDFKRFFMQFDTRRNKNLIENFPRLKDWYNGIQL